MKIAVYPGSFDPFTTGHFEILGRGCEIFDFVYVAVAKHPTKTSVIDVDARVELIEDCIQKSKYKNAKVVVADGLIVELCKALDAKFILRGVRAFTDFEYENAINQTNKSLAPDIDTVFLFSGVEHSFVSSSMVREIARHGKSISRWVPTTTIAHNYSTELSK